MINVTWPASGTPDIPCYNVRLWRLLIVFTIYILQAYYLKMIRILTLLVLIGFTSCGQQQDKSSFVETSIREQQQEKQNELVNYTISKEDTIDVGVMRILYSATVKNGEKEIQLNDSLIYSVTGDDVFVAEY